MDSRLIKLNENSWYVDDCGVRFFILVGTERALMIDSGRTITNARDIAASITDLPISLLNTHADGDHTASNIQFESFYMHPLEESNFRRKNPDGTIIPVNEGDFIDLGERRLEIIHLPGHTPGSIALLDISNRVLISGDPIQNGRIFMFGAHRNMKNYISSLEHLKEWSGTYDEIWPSHGTLPVYSELIDNLISGALLILDRKASCTDEEVFGSKVKAYNLGFATFLCDN